MSSDRVERSDGDGMSKTSQLREFTSAKASLAPTELIEAVEIILSNPRWVSIGAMANTAEIQVSRELYDKAKAALANYQDVKS